MRAIITVLGKDNMGIIYNVTKIVSSYSVNILDISQTIMNSDIFAMVMLVDTAKMQGEFKELAADLKAYGNQAGYDIYVQREDVFNAMHTI
ncbi:MAG TPA: ACT domain-containing protein [Candidatus Avidehalobacter gallistercoris]|uniref:ACT domain-containing protein n=1 Tax=Candidatus Avidehalobacter gallistercoris TaxID=2840694 RepID=A0A9D1HJA2_9FIRM|nr:ACT domain-containing protein [Candidatus Avidehalobacter gallistercoris]